MRKKTMRKTICTSQWASTGVKRITIIYGSGEGKVQVDLIPEDYEHYRRTALIWDLYVHEAYRRQGIANELMRLALDKARDNGYDTATLEWDKRDTPYEILDWYTRLGFEEREFNEGYSLMVIKL